VSEAILQRFGAQVGRRIGHGGEATIYELGDDRVLRICHDQEAWRLAALQDFYGTLRRDCGFALPDIIETGEIDGVAYSVDRRLPGRVLMDVLPDLEGADRATALESYIETAERIRDLLPPGAEGGELFDSGLRRAGWRAYLYAAIDRQLERMEEDLRLDVAAFDSALDRVRGRIRALPEPLQPMLVHGDYFPGNVMVDDDLRVSAVFDFGSLSVMGDPAMDLASAAIFLEVQRNFRPDDASWVRARLIARHGSDIKGAIAAYRGWYALRLAHSKWQDERLYAWCVRSLESA
jgi:aminoglycoside phosphotransferase (APT) family kinase protein